MIPYGRQQISQDDIDSVVAVLRSDFITQGPTVELFERLVMDHCGAAHGVAVNSATSALHIACLALDLGPGDLLWTSPITFLASANAAVYCGADVDFVDVDVETGNMSVEALRDKLQDADRQGRLPKIVMPVHLAGQSCDMAAIGALAKQYGFRVIEDASHAIGGAFQQRPVGSCAFSDICVFSFHPVKIVTTGEGGMAMTHDAALAARMRLLRSHGMTRDPALMDRPPDGPWDYQQVALGYNYRITDIQAALGASQMKRIAGFLAQRRRIADRYDRELAGLAVTPLARRQDTASAWHLYVIRVDAPLRARVFRDLRGAGIGVNVHYIPVHTQPFYRQRFGFRRGAFPQAERYYAEAISLPMYAALGDDEQALVIDAVRQAMFRVQLTTSS